MPFRLDLGYTPNTIRFFALLFIVMSIILILYMADLLIDDPYLNRIVFHTSFNVVLFTIVPIIMIIRNDNLWTYFKKTLRKFRSHLCCRSNAIADGSIPNPA